MDQSLQEVKTSLENLGKSPLKFHGIPSSRKKNCAKRNVDQASHSTKAKASTNRARGKHTDFANFVHKLIRHTWGDLFSKFHNNQRTKSRLI